MLNNIAILVFAILAISYLVQLSSLVRSLKQDEVLWEKIGRPTLATLGGQRKFDRLIFHPELVPITDKSLLRKISTTKVLMLTSLVSFGLVVVTFFLSGKAGALSP